MNKWTACHDLHNTLSGCRHLLSKVNLQLTCTKALQSVNSV